MDVRTMAYAARLIQVKSRLKSNCLQVGVLKNRFSSGQAKAAQVLSEDHTQFPSESATVREGRGKLLQSNTSVPSATAQKFPMFHNYLAS